MCWVLKINRKCLGGREGESREITWKKSTEVREGMDGALGKSWVAKTLLDIGVIQRTVKSETGMS